MNQIKISIPDLEAQYDGYQAYFSRTLSNPAISISIRDADRTRSSRQGESLHTYKEYTDEWQGGQKYL